MMLLPQGAMAGHAYKSAVDELDNSVGRDLDAPFRATVLEPVGKLCSYYPAINDAIAKRNKKVNRLKRIFCYHIKLILQRFFNRCWIMMQPGPKSGSS